MFQDVDVCVMDKEQHKYEVLVLLYILEGAGDVKQRIVLRMTRNWSLMTQVEREK